MHKLDTGSRLCCQVAHTHHEAALNDAGLNGNSLIQIFCFILRVADMREGTS